MINQYQQQKNISNACANIIHDLIDDQIRQLLV